MSFEFGESIPRHWYRDDPVSTHLLNVLSLAFPDGERFFVDAVRHYQDRIDDPERRADVVGFVGQETMHSKEHATFNRLLDAQGYGELAAEAQKTARSLLRAGRIRFTTRERLAVTAALEHVTAILANAILARPEVIEAMHPDVRPLWIWHAIEEIEHKAVAFDLYDAIDGRQPQRKLLLVIGLVFLAVYCTHYTSKFLVKDGVHRRPRVLLRGLLHLLGPGGILTGTIPELLVFFRDDFHPWQHENADLVVNWSGELERDRAARVMT